MSEKTVSISLELQISKAISTFVETFSYKTQKHKINEHMFLGM